MVRLLYVAIAVFLIGACPSGAVQARADQSDSYLHSIHGAIVEFTDKLNSQLLTLLPEEERSILRSVSLRVDEHPWVAVMPHAQLNNRGSPEIWLSVGQFRMMMATMEAMQISHLPNRAGFFERYMRAAVASIREVKPDELPSNQPAPTLWPSDAAGIKSGTPEFATLNTADADSLRWQGCLQGIAFLYLHEVAHHIHHDTRSRPKNNADSRFRESRADSWAIEHMLELDFLPTGAVVPLLIYFFADENAHQHEYDRTHPAEIWRIEAAVRAAEEHLPRFYDRIRSRGMDPDQIDAELRGMLEGIKQLTSEPS